MHLGAIKGKLKTKNAYYTKLGANPIILFDMILGHIPIVNWRSSTIPSFELTRFNVYEDRMVGTSGLDMVGVLFSCWSAAGCLPVLPVYFSFILFPFFK